MNIEKLNETVQAAAKKISDLQDQVKKECQEVFNKEIKEIFASDDKLESFSWRQYNSSNDEGGSDLTVQNEDINFVYGGEEHGDISKWDLKKDNEDLTNEQKNTFGNVLTILKAIPDDQLVSIFGEDVKITVTARGVEIEEYCY